MKKEYKYRGAYCGRNIIEMALGILNTLEMAFSFFRLPINLHLTQQVKHSKLLLFFVCTVALLHRARIFFETGMLNYNLFCKTLNPNK